MLAIGGGCFRQRQRDTNREIVPAVDGSRGSWAHIPKEPVSAKMKEAGGLELGVAVGPFWGPVEVVSDREE